jgi:hypothetical protein
MAHNQSMWGAYFLVGDGKNDSEIIENFKSIKTYREFQGSRNYGICYSDIGSRFNRDKKTQPFFFSFMTHDWFPKVVDEFNQLVDENIQVKIVETLKFNKIEKKDEWGKTIVYSTEDGENFGIAPLIKVTCNRKYNEYSKYYIKYLMGCFFRVLGKFEHYTYKDEPEPISAIELLLERNNTIEHGWGGDVHSACEIGLNEERIKCLMNIEIMNEAFNSDNVRINGKYKYGSNITYLYKPYQTDCYYKILQTAELDDSDLYKNRTFDPLEF